MLNYQTTGFHETAALRELYGLTAIPPFQAWLEKMGRTRENLMACGDGLNDRSMLAFAGTGVAMRNAEDAVKAVASDLTTADNNHDGVAEAIEKFILD